MRIAALSLIGSLTLAATALPANAVPAIGKTALPTVSNIVTVSGGCGRAFHRDAWGYCVPNYRGYYAYSPAWYGSPYVVRYPYRPYRAWY